MTILVDANVFIDYSEQEQYARAFFRKAKEAGWEIGLLREVYFECSRMATDFQKIRTLIAELQKYGSYVRIEATAEEECLARKLEKRLDYTDRLLIAVAKLRGMGILTRDRELLELAKELGVRCL